MLICNACLIKVIAYIFFYKFTPPNISNIKLGGDILIIAYLDAYV